MHAVVLTLAVAFFVAAGLWLTIGSRMKLNEDARQNDILNVLVYFGAALVPSFVVIFFLLERL